VTPDRPETGYGYVLARPPAREVAGRPTFAVERFRGKADGRSSGRDDRDRHGQLERGHLSPGLGRPIRDRLARHAPDILGPLRAICESGTLADLDAAYPALRATSIDYAVMEPASLEGDVAVVR